MFFQYYNSLPVMDAEPDAEAVTGYLFYLILRVEEVNLIE